MIGLGEKQYSESAHMTCGLLCCLCSSVGRTVTDFLSRGFPHELNPLETIQLGLVLCQRPLIAHHTGCSTWAYLRYKTVFHPVITLLIFSRGTIYLACIVLLVRWLAGRTTWNVYNIIGQQNLEYFSALSSIPQPAFFTLYIIIIYQIDRNWYILVRSLNQNQYSTQCYPD